MSAFSIRHTHRHFAIALVGWLTLAGSSVDAQDPLDRAKEFYASAAYEEALEVLQTLRSKTTSNEATEVATYQMFCLVALGRSDEAKHTIEAIVRTDPLYHPSEAQASPRVRALFDSVRRPLLSEIVRQSYSKARTAFDRKEMAAATAEFDRVIALLAEIGPSTDQGLADLRMLATGFRDLGKAATPAPAAPPPIPASTATPPAKPSSAATQSVQAFGTNDKDVRQPVAISLVMPPWRPENPVEARLEFQGSLDLLIGEDGSVLSVVLIKSVHPRYDPLLIQAAKNWKFSPAMKNGKAVKYRFPFGVHLSR